MYKDNIQKASFIYIIKSIGFPNRLSNCNIQQKAKNIKTLKRSKTAHFFMDFLFYCANNKPNKQLTSLLLLPVRKHIYRSYFTIVRIATILVSWHKIFFTTNVYYYYYYYYSYNFYYSKLNTVLFKTKVHVYGETCVYISEASQSVGSFHSQNSFSTEKI